MKKFRVSIEVWDDYECEGDVMHSVTSRESADFADALESALEAARPGIAAPIPEVFAEMLRDGWFEDPGSDEYEALLQPFRESAGEFLVSVDGWRDAKEKP